MITLHVLQCMYCQRDTLLQPSFLTGISPHQTESPKGKGTLNFVCRDCVNGYRYEISQLPPQGFSYNPYEPHGDLSLFHVSLKCEKASCAAHARVHTLAATGSSSTRPALALSEWKLHDIRCSEGHPVKEPPEALPNEPTPLETENP